MGILLLLANDISENPGPALENRNLSILHLNVRSIRYRIDDICDYLEDCDIACFSETHLDCSICTSEIMIENYNEPYRKDRNNRGGGSLFMSNQV